MMNAVNGDKTHSEYIVRISTIILDFGAAYNWAGGEVVRRANGLGELRAAEEALRSLCYPLDSRVADRLT